MTSGDVDVQGGEEMTNQEPLSVRIERFEQSGGYWFRQAILDFAKDLIATYREQEKALEEAANIILRYEHTLPCECAQCLWLERNVTPDRHGKDAR